eukprot:scaffold75086_cov48-Phaeocystis_antarctica.AAC.1
MRPPPRMLPLPWVRHLPWVRPLPWARAPPPPPAWGWPPQAIPQCPRCNGPQHHRCRRGCDPRARRPPLNRECLGGRLG